MTSPEEVVASLGKPDAGSILRLARFLAGKLSQGQVAGLFQVEDSTRRADTGGGIDVLEKLLEMVQEKDLYELGEILLQGRCKVTAESFDLAWLTEALAVWAESVNLEAVLKNVQRLARAVSR